MLDYDVKYLKFKTYLSTYCPHCNKSFNVKDKGTEYLFFLAKYKQQDITLKMSPYLDVFENESSVEVPVGDVLDDLICPGCKTSLLDHSILCAECGSQVTKLTITAFSKLLPFFVCLKHGCEWHGLTKADERTIKLKIPRQEMPEQDRKLRVHNFLEVPFGLTTELAQLEAGRCLQCTKPKCVNGCPVNVDIPAFIKHIRDEEYGAAARKIKERNILAAVCGRVCPQEEQCEAHCVLGIKDKPVAIGNLERFVADWTMKMEAEKPPMIKTRQNKKVAVVGSGPGGITVAADMLQLGYAVTLYEALHEPGGVLVYGIPEFRLPKSIVHHEIEYLRNLGCKIELNTVIGASISIEELLQEYDAVYIGVGAGLPTFMNIEGENLCNIFSANEYLTRINLMKAYRFPEYDTPKPEGNKVCVIGGGNVAMDSARNALRCGAAEVTIVYRRSRKELPAREEEIRHAMEEGIKFKLLTNPISFIGNDINWVRGIECIRMELGEPDANGRRIPIPIEGSEFCVETDLVIIAIGTGPNPILFNNCPELKRNRWGYLEVNPETMETSIPRVYAGGDIVTGSATVISAMGAGRIAANSIHKLLAKEMKETKETKKQ
jgi:glutamate synthase (NADPH/NADH) small chain